MPIPQLQYKSSAMTTAQATGPKRFFYPIPNLEDVSNAFYEDWQIEAASFVTLPLNTPRDAGAFRNYLLQSEGPGQDLSGLCVRWTRGYYLVPPSWDDWQMFAYTFPEYPGATYETFRLPMQLNVQSRLHYDYFVADPNNLCAGLLDAAGKVLKTVAAPGNIPTIQKMLYIGVVDPNFIHDPPQVVPAAGFGGYLPTNPSKETYFLWAANAQGLGWQSNTGSNGDNPGLSQGQIVAEDSQLQRLVGNIWARITRYVQPL